MIVARAATDSGRSTPHAPGIGVITGTALMVAGVLGTGVLVLPGLALRDAGPAALLAVAALLVLSVPLATTFAALGSRYPGAGGVSHFVDTAFGPGPAAITAWWFYLGVPLGIPALGLFAGDYVRTAVGGGPAVTTLTALIVILLAVAANARGVRLSGGLQVMLTGVLVVSLLAVLAVSLPAARAQRLTPFTPHGWTGIAPAALVLVWMLTGWEAVTHLTGRFRDPRRDVPRASAVTLAVIAVLFGGVTLALITVLRPATATGTAPVAALLAMRIGPAAAGVAATLAVMVTLGNANAYVAGLAELGGEMGLVGQAPRWMAERTASGAPTRSLAIVAGQAVTSLTAVTVLGWSAQTLVLLTAASQVAVFAVGLLAALRLLPRRSWGRRSAAVSLPPIVVLAALSGWYLLAPALLGAAALVYRYLSHRCPKTL